LLHEDSPEKKNEKNDQHPRKLNSLLRCTATLHLNVQGIQGEAPLRVMNCI